jgi:hypothetical protein
MSTDKPTERSTRPDGNGTVKPSQLERGLGANVKKALQNFPDQRARINEVLRKKATQSGMAK